MKKILFSLCFLSAMPAFAFEFEKFGEYSIWCDDMRFKSQGIPTDLVTIQPEGNDIDKVTSAYGAHSTNSEGNWKVEFDIKVTKLEKDRDKSLLYIELTTTNKKSGGGSYKGQGVIKSAWIIFDQEWSGDGYLRTEAGTLHRLECRRSKKSSPKS